MITSSAPGPILQRLRQLSGPNPEGSKLIDVERLHLIFLLGVITSGDLGPEVQGWAARFMCDQLKERGMAEEDVLALFDAEGTYSAVQVADMIAVHPSLRGPYLD